MIVTGKSPIPPYPPEHVAFGRRLQQERMSMSCALRRFAQAINWSPTAVSQVEQGDMRNALLVKTMCVKLGVDIREIPQ